MKYTVYIYISLILLFSCGGERSKSQKIEKPIESTGIAKPKGLEKLKSLMALSKDSVMEYFDLSNDSIMDFPDLSGYKIKKLDLSYNLLDTMITRYLPKKIEKLIISHNKLRIIFILTNSTPYLKEIDTSYNQIKIIDIGEPLYKVMASHNNLTYVTLNHKYIRYLDISFNPHFSNKVAFNPSRIDTIIREGIANNKPLYNPRYSYPIIIDEFKATPGSIKKVRN